jgi:hypothetical protein
MAALAKRDIVEALERLGQLAETQSETIQLVLVGGALMVLAYEARQSTRDVDVVILEPKEASTVRAMAGIVAAERRWPEEWLNDAVKGYLVGLSEGPVVFSAPGIEVRRPAAESAICFLGSLGGRLW